VESDPVKGKAASASAEPAAENSESSASAPDAALAEASSPVEAAQLFAEGTKYLLGNGVEQDCARANKDLRAAARFSSDAESTLGTMYASGHCASRDLPTAYRWYARALRGRPGNIRIQDDLTALWNQMSPAERQAASHSEP
jgi:TPR repeat protein